jgi:type IV pilus assembly protein PilO
MQLGLNKLPWYGQVLLFAVISGGGIFSYHYFYASQIRSDIVAKEAQLVRERQDIAKGRAAEKRLVEFRAELAELETRFESLKAVVPEQRDVADMLRRIQTLATQSSLVVKAFRPQAVTNKTLHQEWPMAIELDGTYHNLARFFDQVSKVPRIINVGSIGIKAKTERETEDGTTISAQCTATTFVLLDKAAQAANARKPGARPGVPVAKPPTAAQ